jgi:hypothetical protein
MSIFDFNGDNLRSHNSNAIEIEYKQRKFNNQESCIFKFESGGNACLGIGRTDI